MHWHHHQWQIITTLKMLKAKHKNAKPKWKKLLVDLA